MGSKETESVTHVTLPITIHPQSQTNFPLLFCPRLLQETRPNLLCRSLRSLNNFFQNSLVFTLFLYPPPEGHK